MTCEGTHLWRLTNPIKNSENRYYRYDQDAVIPWKFLASILVGRLLIPARTEQVQEVPQNQAPWQNILFFCLKRNKQKKRHYIFLSFRFRILSITSLGGYSFASLINCLTKGWRVLKIFAFVIQGSKLTIKLSKAEIYLKQNIMA